MISGPYNRNGIVDAEVRANRGAARPDAILDVPRNRTIFRHFSFNYVSGVDAALGVLPGENSLRLVRSEEHTSELQSLMRISYAVFCLKKKNCKNNNEKTIHIFY